MRCGKVLWKSVRETAIGFHGKSNYASNRYQQSLMTATNSRLFEQLARVALEVWIEYTAEGGSDGVL